MAIAPTSLGGTLQKVVLGRDPDLHFVVQLKDQADLSAVRAMPRGADRRAAAWEQLVTTATTTQAPVAKVLEQLKQQGVVLDYSGVPLGNTMFINVAQGRRDDFVSALAATDKVGLVVNESSEDGRMRPIPISPSGGQAGAVDAKAAALLVRDRTSGDYVGWNVRKIGADAAWKDGVTGAGITVGVIDTGIDITNPAVARTYRGADTGSHDYNWVDFVGGRNAPYDDGAHGTHTAGTVAGDTGSVHTGIAPGARLIIAKGLGAHSGSDEGLIRSLQWMLAPTDLSGRNPDARRGADIISNSWGGEAGHPGSEWAGQLYERALAQLKDAGIVTVFAAGNSGPGPSTVGPPGSIKDTITVAATDADDQPASFSSRGPVTDIQSHGKGRIQKPDVAAPGVAVPSSIPLRGSFPDLAVATAFGKLFRNTPGASDMMPVPGTQGQFFTMDGTSMATPAVAGVAALVLSRYPTLDPDQVKQVLMGSARDLGPAGWDADTGNGRVDVGAALKAAARIAG